MWSDIDYMQNYRNFLYDDQLAFKDLPKFIETLHGQNMKWVPILDAGTAARPLQKENYPEYLEGEKDGVFLKINGETFIGQVWPNDAAFPDFFEPKGIKWW
jgi:alpha-glucosidase (family GH31 glycosyl hydrolase)